MDYHGENGDSGGIGIEGRALRDEVFVDADYERAAGAFLGLFWTSIAGLIGGVTISCVMLLYWQEEQLPVRIWQLLLWGITGFFAWRLLACFQDTRWQGLGLAVMMLTLLGCALNFVAIAAVALGLPAIQEGGRIADALDAAEIIASYLLALRLAQMVGAAGRLTASQRLRQAAAHVVVTLWVLISSVVLILALVFAGAKNSSLLFVLVCIGLICCFILSLYWYVRYLMLLYSAYSQLRGAGLRLEQALMRAARAARRREG